MLRVMEGDSVEIDLHNAPDAGVTHSIDLHAVTGPGGGAKIMQITPGDDGAFRFQAPNPGVYLSLRQADGRPAHCQRHVRP